MEQTATKCWLSKDIMQMSMHQHERSPGRQGGPGDLLGYGLALMLCREVKPSPVMRL
jgi:hypothetical protein